MVTSRIHSQKGETTCVPISLRPAMLKAKIVIASRPRFTDAKKPRLSRPWNLNGIPLIKRCPPICACRQTAWRRLRQTDQQDHRSLGVEQVHASVGLTHAACWAFDKRPIDDSWQISRATDSIPLLLQRRSIGLPNCARRARPFRGRALREHGAILCCLAAHFLSFIARSTSRLASRLLIEARRSCCFLPLANPSSTLARPRLEK